GDLAAFGPPLPTVHIGDPRDPRRPMCAVTLREEALATSGARFDPLGSDESTDVAVIDPTTGAPTQAVRGATVRAQTCMLADALTKVVMVAHASAPALLGSLRASALIVLADGEVCLTADWRDAVRLAA